MIDDVRVAPLRAVRAGPVVGLASHGRIEHQVVDRALAQILERLLSEGLDRLQVGQLHRENGQGMRAVVVLELVEGRLGRLGVPGSEDDLVRLGLPQQLLDELEPLVCVRVMVSERIYVRLVSG